MLLRRHKYWGCNERQRLQYDQIHRPNSSIQLLILSRKLSILETYIDVSALQGTHANSDEIQHDMETPRRRWDALKSLSCFSCLPNSYAIFQLMRCYRAKVEETLCSRSVRLFCKTGREGDFYHFIHFIHFNNTRFEIPLLEYKQYSRDHLFINMARPKLTLYIDTVSPFAYLAFHLLRVRSSSY